MPAELIAIEATDRKSQEPRSTYLDKLKGKRHEAHRALEAALLDAGVINPSAGINGWTAIHELARACEYKAHDCDYHLETQCKRLRQQLENVLASDAFSDPEARSAVLTSVNRQRGQRFADSHLYAPVERELIDCYRSLGTEDRLLLRTMLRRLGAPLSSGEVEGAR
jgi:hypothetical protein